MFQQIFSEQPQSLFTWPIIALVLFALAFGIQLVRAVTQSRGAIDEAASQPLRDEDER